MLHKSSLSAGEVIRGVLLADADVVKHTRKIFPVVTDKAELPYILYRRIGLEQQPTKAGKPNADTVQIEVLCFADRYSRSVEMAEAVRHALDHVQAEGDGVSLRSCYLTDSEEVWQDDAFVQMLTFTIKI